MNRRGLFRGLAALALAMNLPVRVPTVEAAAAATAEPMIGAVYGFRFIQSHELYLAATSNVSWAEAQDPDSWGPGKGDVVKVRRWKSA